MHQDIDCFMLVAFPICQMTTSIDSLYKYTTTTSISILTLIQNYSYIPPRSPHHLVQQTHDSSSQISNLQSNMSFIATTKVENAAVSQTRQQWQSYYREKSNWRLAFFVGLPFTPVEVDPVLTECSCCVVAATSMLDASSICVAVQENNKCLMDPLTQIHIQHR